MARVVIRPKARRELQQVVVYLMENAGPEVSRQYRLATYIDYRTAKVYIRHVMTHEKYGRADWKKR